MSSKSKRKTIKYLVALGIITLLAVSGWYFTQTTSNPTKAILSSSTVYPGNADGSNGKEVWPLTIKFTKFNEADGKFEGELEWPTLKAIHKIAGTLDGEQITFEETEFIKKGSATLDCSYTLNYDSSKNEFVGTWHVKSNPSDKGKIWIKYNK